MEYTYIYCITWRCYLVHVSIGLAFKTAFYGECDFIYLKFDSEYYGDLILRKQHNNDKLTNDLLETDMISHNSAKVRYICLCWASTFQICVTTVYPDFV